ncbi:MAG: ribosome maturation factor RimP [Oscillospiraceae bacterium]|nr:ribosome maturation factor RimP [Oscillospiraceae bacterium]
MASNGKGGSVAAAVAGIAESAARELGLTVWDVRFVKEGAGWFLRVFIDKEGGVGIEDCEAFSRLIDAPLDELDPVEHGYCLEVSSPGVERDLTRPEHFAACAGKKVKLRTIRPVDGQRDFSGVLESYDNGMITLRAADGPAMNVTKKETSFIKLDDFK